MNVEKVMAALRERDGESTFKECCERFDVLIYI